MSTTQPQQRLRRAAVALRTQWRELGGFGRVSVIGIVLSMAVAIVLGFVIPALVKRNLTDTRVDTYQAVAQDLEERDLIPIPGGPETDLEALATAIDLRLLGGDTLRVKLWTEDGLVLYSDAPELIGQTFPASEDRTLAFSGEVTVRHPDLARPENQPEAELGPLREYYIPVRNGDGPVPGVFEVYEDSGPLDATVAATRRIVWLSIGIGLGILFLFMGALVVANARIITGRARAAERQLTALAQAREDERHRIVGALHDDIGQPLYRVLMGIQGSRSQIDPASPVASELGGLEDLVRSIDGNLRTELRLLHHGSVEQLDLDTLLEELADKTRAETDLEVEIEIQEHRPLTLPVRAALLRAASEAVTNARKHSGADAILIRVHDGAGRLLVDVEDDGAGISAPPGLGLTTTRERLEALGGGLRVTDRRGTGTLFRAWVGIEGDDG
ncbi:MAG: sensor histidine kinase [Acidimicrobiia bacterium]